MTKLIIYLLFSYGLSNLLVYGSGPWNVLSKFREFSKEHLGTIGDMLQCMMCTSTNIGWILSLFNLIFIPSVALTPCNALFDGNSVLMWLVIIIGDACITSGGVWLMHTAQEYLEGYNYGD